MPHLTCDVKAQLFFTYNTFQKKKPGVSIDTPWANMAPPMIWCCWCEWSTDLKVRPCLTGFISESQKEGLGVVEKMDGVTTVVWVLFSNESSRRACENFSNSVYINFLKRFIIMWKKYKNTIDMSILRLILGYIYNEKL